MQASGEQTRKNYRSQGVEDRLSRITQGEQDRLGYAAQGDQQRRNIRTTAQEGRKTYDFEDRLIRELSKELRIGRTGWLEDSDGPCNQNR